MTDTTTLGWDREVDVVVAGTGAAGSAAALEAGRRGATVLVVEKESADRAGGNTRVAGGVWFHHDDPVAARRYLTALCGPLPVDDAVADVWSAETGANTAWIRSLGAEVEPLDMHKDPEYPRLGGSDAYRGFHAVDGTWGRGHLHRFLRRSLDQAGIEVAYETPLLTVAAGPDGEVTGVEVGGPTPARVRARRGIVLATGGFQNDPNLVAEHLSLETAVPWGSPANTGDGHRMAAEIGAAMGPMDNHMPMVGLRGPGFEAGFPIHLPAGAGFCFVNERAQRFMDETLRNCHGHVDLGDRYDLALRGRAWVVFDERALRSGPINQHNDVAPFGWNNQQGTYRWSDDNQAEIEAGWIARGDTPAELAEALGLPAEALATTIATYDEGCRDGLDPDGFGRPAGTLLPLDESPYYGFAWGPLVAFTTGGPRRNERAEVLDGTGRPIPGLYAAGELAATYTHCVDGGMMIADALAFGRIAGRTAASRLP